MTVRLVAIAILTSLLSPILAAIQRVPHGNWLGPLEGDITRYRVFDYIIAGGGTAGSALSLRLAEAGFRVALVEAGGTYEDADGGEHTVPSLDLAGVGWSTDDVSADGVDWGLDQLLPYYKRSVTFSPPRLEDRKANTSAIYFNPRDFDEDETRGPVDVGFSNYVSAWSTWLESGLRSVGLDREDEFNAGSLDGYHYTTTSIRSQDGTRSSAATFVYAARRKRLLKLSVFLRTQATKIIFKGRRATGMEVVHNGVSFKLKANKEVILSAGAFQSPQLLMVSGVGPIDTLRQLDIPIVKGLAGVGQNMWDHVMFGTGRVVRFPTRDELLADPLEFLEAEAEYRDRGTGVLSSGVIDLVGWEKLPARYRDGFSNETRDALASFPSDWPEIEYMPGDGYIGNFSNVLATQPADGRQYATILGALVAPLSRGNVSIRSASALDPPVIQPNWLSHPADQAMAVALFRRMREVWDSPGLSHMTEGPEYFPGPEIESDSDVLDMIRKSLMTVWHPSCTCKMGRPDDEMAVVDSRGRVHGVEGLRVVDASAMPLLPPGHPQSTVYALAEKIAEDIVKTGREKGKLV
ncbi:hypothetical protein CDD80_1553 [Ophiocordyceps camponoti-rufipedis]|uniref:Glucose-methanol-choline oxidoreductase N-terminal domain-containing protein n=1 Tax=Ophiocordyceps camponoti-rufipedis TaxID=2004952 RepID=A0A2C5XLT8_9HYPO|nr:hypothetical protein CDD80_1553 [Ophiocordyceps camponoti-rufipedis]